jgi:hypothetical protein
MLGSDKKRGRRRRSVGATPTKRLSFSREGSAESGSRRSEGEVGGGGAAALGLGLRAGGGRQGFRAWAARMGFRTFEQLSPRMPTDVQRINEAMRAAKTINFNMKGFVPPSVPQLVIRAGELWPGTPTTNTRNY